MGDYVQADKATTQKPDQNRDTIAFQTGRDFVAPDRGSTSAVAAADSLNQSARVQPLLQLRQALNQSPRAQAQLALQRALNRSPGAHPDEEEPVQTKLQRDNAGMPSLSRENPSLGTKSVAQLMSIRGAAQNSTISGATSAKHVVAAVDQAAAAKNNYGDSTFVRTDAALTDPVDADNHDFTEAANTRSARFPLAANVTIDQWDKVDRTQAGRAKDLDVAQTIDAAATACDIGVTKTGADAIQIDHFTKA